MKKIILPLLFITLFIGGCGKIETPNQNSPETPQTTECRIDADCPTGHRCNCQIIPPPDCPQCEGGDLFCMCVESGENCANLGQIGPNGSLGPNDPNQNVECCSGLILKSPKKAFTNDCHSGEGFGTVCIACGDGICDSNYESNCNCPEDCE